MLKCVQCAQEVQEGSRFCGKCGTPVNSGIQEAGASEPLSKETPGIENIFQDDPVQCDIVKTDAKLDLKPLFQMIGLLVVVAVLLALIWKE